MLKGNRCLLWLTFSSAASAMVYEVTDYWSFAFQRCSRVASLRGKPSQQCFGVRLSTSFVIYSKLPDSKTLLLEHTCAFSKWHTKQATESCLHIPLLWLSPFLTAFTIAARATKKAMLRVAALSSPNFSSAPLFWYRHRWQFLRLGNATSSASGSAKTRPEDGKVSCDFR